MKGSQQVSPGVGLRRRVLSWPTLATTVVAATVLGLVLWQAFDIDWTELRKTILGISPVSYALALGLYYTSFWFRGYRWRLISKTAGIGGPTGERVPGTFTMGGIILMGWFANSVAFLRVGDAYRGWVLSRQTGASFGESLGTILAERVQDMVAVLLLVLVAAAWISADPDVEVPLVVLVAAVLLVALLVTLLLAMRRYGQKIARLVPSRFRGAYENFQRGTLASFNARGLPLQLGLGIAGWSLEMLRFYFVADGLGIDISFGVIMFAALANAMLSTIPTPGGFGFVEGGLPGLLILMGLDDTSAVGLTIVDRTISWLSVIVFGGLLFLYWNVFRKGKGSSGAEQTTGAAPSQSVLAQPES